MADLNIKREVKYNGIDFVEARKSLISLAKNYYPNVYRDFNPASPAMMFVEMVAYTSDVLSFYNNVQLQESFINIADERLNIYNHANAMGYKTRTIVPASVELEVFQLVPSVGEGTNSRPDYRYAFIVEPNMVCSTTDGVKFYTKDSVDFRYSSSYDPTETSIYSVSNTGAIEYYLLRKNVKAISGEIRTATYPFDDPKKYDKIVLQDTNISEIIDVIDSDGNTWYETPYLANDLVPISTRNTPYNNIHYSKHRTTTPYILCYHQTERRFITRLRKDDKMEIQFGGGLSGEADEEILPNPYNVAIGLDYFARVVDVSIDPQNFLNTHTYGSAPNNTNLTIRYAVATGISDNVNAGTITTISSKTIVDPIESLNASVLNTIKNSLAVNNLNPAFGGQDRKELDVIRQEAIANFAAQNRSVTKEDYILRCYTMPPKYGAIAKAYVEQDQQLSRWNEYDKLPNPYAINLYVLGYDINKNLVPVNEITQENLRNYLSQYRLMTDAVNIKTPFIINIGINFEIVVRPAYNSNEIILKCIESLMKMFSPDKMEINQPILISKVYTELDKVEGVQTVQSLEFVNLFDVNSGYSGHVYDIRTATRNGVLYPSLDVSIFSIQFPKRDLVGRANDI